MCLISHYDLRMLWPACSASLAIDWPVRLCICHINASFVVVDKPAGMLSVPGRGEDKRDSVASRVKELFPNADGPLIVHRLDMETSGVMVFALNAESHRNLSKQFMDRQVDKSYIAILDGILDFDDGVVDIPLSRDWPNRPRQMVDTENGKHAISRYQVLDRDTNRALTLVRFRPETGRTHQLRLHAAASRAQGGLGLPILGDSLYGDQSKAPRLMLHAEMLAFFHPDTGQRLIFTT